MSMFNRPNVTKGNRGKAFMNSHFNSLTLAISGDIINFFFTWNIESFDNFSWNCKKIRIEMRLSKKFYPIEYLFSSCLEFVIAHWVVILILVSFYVIFFYLTFLRPKQFNSTLCTACFLYEYHTTIAPPQSQILAQK